MCRGMVKSHIRVTCWWPFQLVPFIGALTIATQIDHMFNFQRQWYSFDHGYHPCLFLKDTNNKRYQPWFPQILKTMLLNKLLNLNFSYLSHEAYDLFDTRLCWNSSKIFICSPWRQCILYLVLWKSFRHDEFPLDYGQ